jgi:hypothetical protein
VQGGAYELPWDFDVFYFLTFDTLLSGTKTVGKPN